MKPLLLSAILFLSLIAQAQNWCPPGATWTYNHYGFDFYGKTDLSYEKDTTINGQAYKMLVEHTTAIYPMPIDWRDTTYTFERNDTVFNIIDGDVYPIYFFNASLSDTLNLRAFGHCDSTIKWVVDSVAVSNINGQSLRYYRAKLAVPDIEINPQTMEVMERFGSINNFVVPSFQCLLDDGSSYRLRCYADDAFSQYRVDTTVTCDYLYNGINKVELNANLTLYPNPATHQLNISIEGHTITQYQVMDYSGKTVITHATVGNNIGIDVTSLPQGIYLIKLELDNGQYAIRRFIHEN